MLFNTKQINLIARNVDFYHTLFIAENVGTDILTKADKALLRSRGIDLAKYKDRLGTVEYAYNFGKMESTIRDKGLISKLDLKHYKDFVAKNPDQFKLSKQDKFNIHTAKQQMYNDIMRAAADIKADLRQNLIEVSKTYGSNVGTKPGSKTIIKAVTRTLAESTKKYSGRFELISSYNMHSAYQMGIAGELLQRKGNTKVYFSVHPDACDVCVRVYLKNGKGSQPKILYLQNVINNGSNIGRKGKDIKPSLNPVHPHSIADKRTMVCTSTGWKKISDIKVGELVLSHKGKFRKVEAVINGYVVPKNYPIKKKYRISFLEQTKSSYIKTKISLDLTAEHLVLTTRGWIRAMELIKQDKLLKVLIPCKNSNCSNYVEFLKEGKGRKCCSKKCHHEVRAVNTSLQWKSGAMPNLNKLRDDIDLLKNNSKDKYLFKELNILSIKEFNIIPGITKLYDLQVAKDKSFIANGVVIHNCRCKLNFYPGLNSIWSPHQNKYIRKFT